ncbi:heterokaryon incompatibility protein-domain-containing protein [Penicillium pulvis]|uniref:heterokaryon incompatibility protein-domain-containing protein n=1 Tax=Penicillium pulvis TaxID=1562058 RepID=UPI002548C3F4|nr:heterokaryon incompatibility protein-domain-containing protein [Penicillium pulvis]KAJ5798420.1 heterokaryon incompatibility protein-domain-containing protein [Penicillium pulvis]
MALLDYLPLTEHHDIRLIDIIPGAFTDTLQIKVFHCRLEESHVPQYEALSYVWGSSDSPTTIRVQLVLAGGSANFHEFLVTQNLAVALQHLRLADSVRTVWADAICINQLDYAEKSQQVMMIGDIYRLARRVIGFLGPAQDDSDLALEILENLADMVEVDFSSGLIKSSAVGTKDSSWADMHSALPYGRREILAIYHLICRDWFGRLWIRQEIGLSGRQGTLLCGSKAISWPLMCKAIFIIQRKPSVSGVMNTTEQEDDFRRGMLQIDTVCLYSRRAFSFLNLRRQIRSSKCSDPRDRLYGVLNHLRDSGDLGIIPDYNKTASDIYTDATQRHIRHTGRLAILCQCELDDHSVRSEPLPSWVPDLAAPMDSLSVHEVGPELFELLPAFSSMNDCHLGAYGFRIGRVEHVIRIDDYCLHNVSDSTTARELRRALMELDSHIQAGNNTVYNSREKRLEAYCRSLWLNNFAERWMPAVPHESPYNDSLALVRALLDPENSTAKLPSHPNTSRCLVHVRAACTARTLYITADGHVGMGPAYVRPDDEVCHLFGSWKPMVLRPVAGQYRQVGECYLEGGMHGEVILGELPANLRSLLDPHGLRGLQRAGFVDITTGLMYKEDPRMLPFLTGLVESGLIGNSSLQSLEEAGAMDVLIKAGFKIINFELI